MLILLKVSLNLNFASKMLKKQHKVFKIEEEEVSKYFKSNYTMKTRAGAKKYENLTGNENDEAPVECKDTVKTKITKKRLHYSMNKPKEELKMKEREGEIKCLPENIATNECVERELENTNLGDIEDFQKWQPVQWREVLSLIRTMRSGRDAPVDSMGCDQCADESAPDPVKRLHHLLSLMLSSQTKDQVTFAAMERLRNIKGGLTLDTLLALPEEELARLLHPVGFYKSKAKYIKATCLVLKNQYSGDIPDSVEGLCSLPGVGPKMAHLCMQSAWGVVSGIGVDTHVHRISNRLGWCRRPTNAPEKTRVELESWLPRELWREVNHLLVGFGQTICKPIQPDCAYCLARDLCPSAGKQSPTKKKKKKKN